MRGRKWKLGKKKSRPQDLRIDTYNCGAINFDDFMFFISWTFSSALAPPRFQVDGAAGSIWKPTDRQDEDDQEGVGSRSEQLFREEREEKRAKFGLRKDLSERFPNGFAEWGALYDAAVEAAIASFVYRQTSWPGELSVLTWSTVRLSLSLWLVSSADSAAVAFCALHWRGRNASSKCIQLILTGS